MEGWRGELSEHLLEVLASVIVCAGFVFFWSHHRSEHKGEWTKQDTLAFRKCVIHHITDVQHYFNFPLAFAEQIVNGARGEECRAELNLPPNKPKEYQALHEPMSYRDWNEIEKKMIEAKLPVPPSYSNSAEPSDKALQSPTPSPADLGEWLKQLNISASTVDSAAPIHSKAGDNSGSKSTRSAKSTVPRDIPNTQKSRFLSVLSGASGVILDTKSGLMWMSQDFWNIEGHFARDWHEAMTWAVHINGVHFAGYSDWTAPTIAQYRTINKSRTDREEYARVFPHSAAQEFWASNSLSDGVASYTDFEEGFATSGSKTRNPDSSEPWKYSVRLVRVSHLEIKP